MAQGETLQRRLGSLASPPPWAALAALALALVSDAVAAETQAGLEQAEHQQPAQKQQAYEQAGLSRAGSPHRGGRLFRDSVRTKCAVCHKVAGEGGAVGPDLSAIGGKFDRPHLIESLLEPSRQIVEGYRATTIVTHDGEVLTGIVRQESAERIVLVDAEDRRRELPPELVAERRDSPLSLMPTGLADALSLDEFADLVAYLESLRSAASSPGEATRGPVQLHAGFELRTVATSLSGAVALEAAPDDRLFVCEQQGHLRIVRSGQLLKQPFVTLPVDASWERGLLGVTVQPDFPRAPYVYVCYIAAAPYPHHVISRWTAEGDRAAPGSEHILLSGDDQRGLGGNVPAGHQGGAIHFGPDGKLYAAIGDQTAGAPAQRLDTLQGKLLRLDADGRIPADNPFVSNTCGKYRSIWALGLRNPFTFAFQPRTGLLLINDVGGEFEEINLGQVGANYGWPAVEHGRRNDARYHDPIYQYPQASIAGGAFVPVDGAWPSPWRGRYLFADFVHGSIEALDPAHPQDVLTLVQGLRRPVDLRFGPQGQLYVLLRNAWVIDDKFQTGTSSLVEIRRVAP